MASRYVHSLFPAKCSQKLRIKKYPVLRSSLKGINLYQTAGRRKTKRKKKGGSPLSSLQIRMHSILKKIKSKKNPGVFPNTRNRNIYLLNKTPKVHKGGKRKRRKSKRSKKGGFRSQLMNSPRSKKKKVYNNYFSSLFNPGTNRSSKKEVKKFNFSVSDSTNSFNSKKIDNRPMFNHNKKP